MRGSPIQPLLALTRRRAGRSMPARAARPTSMPGVGLTVLVGLASMWPAGADAQAAAPVREAESLSGASYLALLPDGETKRRFILDCTGCHVWTRDWVEASDGTPRDSAQWAEAIARMREMFGPGTGFPIISSWTDAATLGAWLAAAWGTSASLDAARDPDAADLEWSRTHAVHEYPIPQPQDLPHDLMVDEDGKVLITGMFTHRMYRLDPESGEFSTEAIPVANANPRALDLDPAGRWIVLLGGPGAVARHDPADGSWESWSFGAYPHSVHPGPDGRIWWNGHFTVAPELIGAVDPATGEVERFTVEPHPGSDVGPEESTIPYGLRVSSDGTVWGTQLRGGGLVRLDPESGRVRTFQYPLRHAGPRRPDPGPDGGIWIPAYAAGQLARFDPETESFRVWDIPVRDVLPYVVRVDSTTGIVWIGTGHGDMVLSFDPATERFTAHPLPTRGALIRHIDVDETRGEVWLAYGASPGIPSKVARLVP